MLVKVFTMSWTRKEPMMPTQPAGRNPQGSIGWRDSSLNVAERTPRAAKAWDRRQDARIDQRAPSKDAVKRQRLTQPARTPAGENAKGAPWGQGAPAPSTTVRSTECLPAKRSEDGCVPATRKPTALRGT